jgi:hypothetical protein
MEGFLMSCLVRVVLLSVAILSLLSFEAAASALQESQPAAAQGPNPAEKAAAPKPGLAPPPSISIPRVSRPPKLEEFLNNTPREAETKVTDFRQREPHDGEPASQATAGYLSYDDKHLYVVIHCTDQTDLVRAHLSKREDIFNDDVVGIMLDTFNDKRRAYEFFVNPLGIQLDGTTVEGQNDDFSFDTLWHSEGRLTSDGFIVLLAIPFKSLRFSNADPQTWGIAIFRALARNNEQSFWPHITRRIQGFCQQMATVNGFESISPGRNVQIIPYGSFASARFLDGQIPAFRTDNDLRGGVDAKVVLRDSLTVDFTLNPDFSQVESDEPQVTVNQRFEVFFPEKRPFFLENSSFFQTFENLFFSRRIADPQFGVRLTGKMGPWAVAGLAMDDRAPGKQVPQDDPLSGDRAAVGVVRVQREFAKQSSIGIFASSRDFAGSSNRVAALDTRIKLGPTWTFQGQAIASTTRGRDGGRVAGPAYSLGVFHDDRHLNYSFFYTDRSPGFRTALGFVPRVDIRQLDQFISYRWRPKKGRVQAYGPNLFLSINWDRQGRVQDWRVNLPWAMDFSNNTHIFIRRTAFYELFEGRGFREHTNDFQFASDWPKWIGMYASVTYGKGVNFFPAAGLEPFSAKTFNGSAGITLRVAPQWRFEQTYIYDRLGTGRESTGAGVPERTAIFNNHIFRSKLNYQFTRALSLRAILDYNAVLPNTSLIGLDRAKRLTGDVLVTYLLHPGTALYVGYTDNYENLRIDPTMPPSLRRTASPTTGVGRQFFVKMSYLFRF